MKQHVLERPLFWEERRPLTPAAVVSQPVSVAPTKLEGVTCKAFMAPEILLD